MSILCTFPGKFGDILWALPTVRALSRRVGAPVDLAIAAPFGSLAPLIEAQPYVGRCLVDPLWTTQDTAPISPRVPPGPPLLPPLRDLQQDRYAQTFHLGYRGWPQRALPFETVDCLNDQLTGAPYLLIDGNYCKLEDAELCLGEPWITVFPPCVAPWEVVCGFTDEHFELKYGLVQLIDYAWSPAAAHPDDQDLQDLQETSGRIAFYLSAMKGNRWHREGGCNPQDGWREAASVIADSAVFLGCNSALHVLAVACGTPVVLMEPNPHRHHDIFYPLGRTGPQVTLVTGTDGLPTWDARHVADALTAVLSRSTHR